MVLNILEEEDPSGAGLAAAQNPTEADAPMSGDGRASPRTASAGWDAHEHARAIVKLLQCAQCSYPLREPMTLPCGNTLCRPCLPPFYRRQNITYPLMEERKNGFLCPFKACGMEHSAGDCGVDVTLNKLLHVVRGHIAELKARTPECPILLEEKLDLAKIADTAMDIMPRSRVLQGGRLVATYIMADMGELNYHSDLAYTLVDRDSAEAIRTLDQATLDIIRESVRAEMECQVCYQLMHDPLTTSCGHTFCRKCFARARDHSLNCPMCRRRLPMLPSVSAEPSNNCITHLIEHLLPELLAARQAVAEQEDVHDDNGDLPLFPCTLAYPQMPTFLHIFEPRYRLMIRRVMDSGTRKFGMLMWRPTGHPPTTPHWQPYGTVLFIERMELFPDGRSLIETRGLYKFRVLETSMLDGYIVGRVQRIDDIPLHEEENVESQETSRPALPSDDERTRINHMSTQALLQYALAFVEGARGRSARWLHQRVLTAYGQPPSDPAIFPYWLASVLPITEHEKYLLLPATSVRERLKITALWIERLEQARCEYEAEQRARANGHDGSLPGDDTNLQSPAPAPP